MNKLERGGNCIISGSGSKVDDIVVALGWHTKSSSDDFELDASAFLLKKDGTVRSDSDFIFYNQTGDQENALLLECSPQNLHHDSEFHIRLSKLSEEIEKVVIVLTIYHAVERRQNFSMVDQIFIKILEKGFKGQELACYEVKDADREIALTLGEMYRHRDSWKFRSVGQGFNGGLDVLASQFGVDIDAGQEEGTESSEENIAAGLKRTRRSQQQMLAQKTHALQKNIGCFFPDIQSAVEKKINESNTRMILNEIFMDVFGYKMEEIKAEQKIQGRKADYVLAVDDADVLVVEVKRAGMALRDKQIFQATSYGAYSGIKWVLLTNLQIWQVYHISTQDRIESDLVFSIDLLSDLKQEDFEKFFLISRYGISRKNLLKKLWREVSALSHENIISAVLSEDVINKLRSVIRRDTGCNIENEKIQRAIEEILQIN